MGSPRLQKPRPRRCPQQRLGFLFWADCLNILILMGSFIVSPPVERRHTRQRIAEKPSRQIARLEFGSAITIRQCQGTGPNVRREREMSGLAAASSFIQDFGHCSFSPYGLPKPQPYGTPAPWPKGDGRLSGLGPNMGTYMKTRAQFQAIIGHCCRRK
jgi:hypothetical protein